MTALKWRLLDPAELEQYKARCRAQPSKRSTARCEMPVDHKGVTVAADFHCGRTRGGYWKSWRAEPAEAAP